MYSEYNFHYGAVMSRFKSLLARAIPVVLVLCSTAAVSSHASATVSSGNVAVDPTFGVNGTLSPARIRDASQMANFGQISVLASGRSLTRFTSINSLFFIRHKENGEVDSTYGSAGRSDEFFLPQLANAPLASDVAPDGRAVVMASGQLVSIAPDGSADTSFGGGDGIIALPSLGTQASFTVPQVRILPTGRLLVAGEVNGTNNSTDMFVMRFRRDGSLDTSFGFAGIARALISTTAGRGGAMVNDLNLLDNGKVDALATYWSGNYQHSVIVRFTTAGDLDSAWGSFGRLVVSDVGFLQFGMYGFAWNGAGYDMAGVSSSTTDGIEHTTIARVDGAGALDPSFGSNGSVVTASSDVPNHDVVYTSIGTYFSRNHYDSSQAFTYVLSRFTSTGTFDSSFGTGGSVTIPGVAGLESASLSYDAAADGSLRAVTSFCGQSFNCTDASAAAVRFHRIDSTGQFSQQFAASALSTTNIDAGVRTESVGSVAVRPDGKIIVLSELTLGDTNVGGISLRRFNADGSVDSSFGSGGRANFEINGDPTYSSQMVLQPDGRILVTASTGSSWPRTGSFIVRFTANGVLDNTFGSNGIVALATDSPWAGPILVDAQGRIVVAGSEGQQSSRAFLLRLNADGSPDQTFVGPPGTTVGTGKIDLHVRFGWISGLLAAPNDKIFVSGQMDDTNGMLMRLNTDGTLDGTYNNNGYLSLSPTMSDPNVFADIEQVEILSDGSARGVLMESNGQGSSFSKVVAISTSGFVDTTYGTNGYATLPSRCAPDGFHPGATGTMQDGTGLLIGTTSQVDVYTWAAPSVPLTDCIVRLDSSGRLDTSFGTSGVFISTDENRTTTYRWMVRTSTDAWLDVAQVSGANDLGTWRLTKYAPSAQSTSTSSSSPSTTAAPATSSPATTVPGTSSTVASTTTVPVSGGSVVAANLPTLRKGTSTAATTVGRKIGITGPAGSKTTLTVTKSSSKVCKVAKGKLVALATGTCSITVKVSPKGSTAVTIRGTIIVN